ncbi:unnamed protein product [Clonostachys rosea]|uniref:F-box domain-containing protein n=1 Tax=Bionectria ochroleuca TaxID=29856 RepID=A0ABY6TVN3_BIOOC|nr:unnamed protein product [Clonostachys rosea]
MAIPRLCDELLLRVIEFSDIETISSLKKIPGLTNLMESYERSIMKNIHRMSTPVAPDEGHSPFVLTYDLSDLEVSVSGLNLDKEPGSQDSAQGKPDLTHMNSFVVLEKLRKRDNELEILLRAPYFLLERGPGATPPSWPAFPNKDSKSLLRSLLKRAIDRCGVLADMEGRAVVDVGKPSQWYDYMPESGGDTATTHNNSYSAWMAMCATEHEIKSELVPKRTLELQMEYLESLSFDSLVELHFLGTYLAECRRMASPKTAPMELEDFIQEHLFQESILRHGSWTLYGEIRGYGARSAHCRQMRDKILEEMVFRSYEENPAWDMVHLEGLRAAVHSILLRRVGGVDIWEIGALRAQVYKRVGAMIGAPDAFKNPPSLATRPTWCEHVNYWWY